ncbi:DEAD/DEAH box helicase [Secundilactobacillus malefermentans]|uniref:DEAD/DEAH box helicase n=1 Tax=Secundilactobacillus malefermentans TaxID=176292 RepID=UPI0011CBB03D|nr:DEAD/DEAH box helicase [Secundilactobacillus malefermentans]QEA30935.1 DEAD/DEAH box helicase [Secundilactobacillus malefermentans]
MLEQFKEQFEKRGYEKPTAIQEAVFEPMSQHKSVLGLAPTGSGKTVAFILPILGEVVPGDGSQILILSPSQELAMQTTSVIRDWAKSYDVKVLALTGGANVKRQMEQLRKRPEIIIGTPGRVLNLVEDRKLKLHLMQTIIIDEADDLLAGETLETVRNTVEQAPADVQLGFFSATETPILHELPKWFGQEVETFDVRLIDDTQGQVAHDLLQISPKKRVESLKKLSTMENFRALVFFNEMSTLKYVVSRFRHEHVAFAELTSDARQVQREKALKDFRLGRVKLLLTTDVAARGLDIPKLPAVVNFDLPSTPNTYVHRAGRTGRMGEPGLVVSMGDDHDLRDFRHQMAKSDYEYKRVYFFKKALVERIPDQPKARVEASTTNSTSTPTGRETHKGAERAKREPYSSAKVVETPIKKKGHKKHQKNKGMRKKRREQSDKV